MIAATGAGALASERIPIGESRWFLAIPLSTAGLLWLLTITAPALVAKTVHYGLGIRCLLVVAVVTPISLLFGTQFPIGMRIARRLSHEITPWLWGVNGAFGVLASVGAVAVSMTFGIRMTFWLAAATYALVALPARSLQRAGGGV